MKLIVVHFNPLEKFPPVVNFLKYCSTYHKEFNIEVITSFWKGLVRVSIPEGVQVWGIKWNTSHDRFLRVIKYLMFNLKVLARLISSKPDVVFYYETISSWAPVFYKRLIKRNVRLFIHYHEYTSIHEYQSGMALNRWFHVFEKNIYPQAEWISHTNNHRLELFKRDIQITDTSNLYAMPNYPPVKWSDQSQHLSPFVDDRIAFVYVGALSFETMYLKEFAEFVSSNPSTCYWDIYSDNYPPDLQSYLKQICASNIFFKGSIPYNNLPAVLPKYDIGLILYKATTQNFEFNAPNKYFEYVTCGLNVLYPPEMKGMFEFDQLNSKPWTRRVNFESLGPWIFDDGKKENLVSSPKYFGEKVYSILCSKINAANSNLY